MPVAKKRQYGCGWLGKSPATKRFAGMDKKPASGTKYGCSQCAGNISFDKYFDPEEYVLRQTFGPNFRMHKSKSVASAPKRKYNTKALTIRKSKSIIKHRY